MIPTKRLVALAIAPLALIGAAAGADDAPIINPSGCLSTGDGYLRAHLAGAIDATLDWPNSGTRCGIGAVDTRHGTVAQLLRALACGAPRRHAVDLPYGVKQRFLRVRVSPAVTRVRASSRHRILSPFGTATITLSAV